MKVLSFLNVQTIVAEVKKALGLHPAYYKYAVAVAGIVAQVVNLNLVHGAAQHDLVVALAAATALGVRRADNA